jgi:hypothetical protein
MQTMSSASFPKNTWLIPSPTASKDMARGCEPSSLTSAKRSMPRRYFRGSLRLAVLCGSGAACGCACGPGFIRVPLVRGSEVGRDLRASATGASASGSGGAADFTPDADLVRALARGFEAGLDLRAGAFGVSSSECSAAGSAASKSASPQDDIKTE